MTAELAWIAGLLVGLVFGIPIGLAAALDFVPGAVDRTLAFLSSADDRRS